VSLALHTGIIALRKTNIVDWFDTWVEDSNSALLGQRLNTQANNLNKQRDRKPAENQKTRPRKTLRNAVSQHSRLLPSYLGNILQHSRDWNRV